MKSANIQFSADVQLPSLVKRELMDQAMKLLEKHMTWFGWSQLDLHLRYNGPRIECQMNLVTDDGRYHAVANGWDVRQIVHDAITRIELQLHKRMERRAAYAY